jgi:hypothetical protein
MRNAFFIYSIITILILVLGCKSSSTPRLSDYFEPLSRANWGEVSSFKDSTLLTLEFDRFGYIIDSTCLDSCDDMIPNVVLRNYIDTLFNGPAFSSSIKFNGKLVCPTRNPYPYNMHYGTYKIFINDTLEALITLSRHNPAPDGSDQFYNLLIYDNIQNSVKEKLFLAVHCGGSFSYDKLNCKVKFERDKLSITYYGFHRDLEIYPTEPDRPFKIDTTFFEPVVYNWQAK